ncbi:unnamed protein product [Dracunculus medinensis]|uniref:Protein asunder n=1 Tax=Dracunculus medinensis TaxID=318479 RepID=A0A0N4UM92_DRAME|nr:unnamed protein product [Dracunculus medinensis]
MHVNVYIVCLIPVSNRSDDERITSKPLTKINEHVSCCVRCAEADPSFRSVVHSVIMDQYDLVSTTVTSIPMKEEAQQGQSVNYDVEVFHPRRSYIILEKLNLIDSSSKLRSRQLGGYDTIQLSWTTPSAKNRWNQYPRCISAVPVSPASVNSRPSVCLTSFLLGGRNVMLEVLRQNIDSARDIPPNINQKLISHLLMCHAGHIFMHTLWVGEHPLFDDKKLIAAAQMPQVDGLRVIDFGALMKECHLIVPPTAKKESANTYNERARKHLKRLTRFWPLLLTDAFIYNIPKKFEPLLSLIKKRELSTSDVNKCREFFHTFMSYKDTKEPLTAKTINCIKFKNPLSRDEQFRISCNEILNHLRNYVNHSERHLEVFNVFLQISGLDRSTHLSIVDVSLIDCKCINIFFLEKLNLYDFFLKKYQKERWSKWKDFVGRQNSLSNPVVLYPHLDVSKSGKAIEIDQ